MPAVELFRLRYQINGLIECFNDPLRFRSALKDLLETYSNHAYHAGQAVQPQSLLPTYRVPPLITHTLELELSKTCQELPSEALEAVQVLWEDSYLETRMLATTMLGAIPASHASEVLQKVRAWAKSTENFRMLDALFLKGTATLRRSASELLLGLIEEWLDSSRAELQTLGLRALTPLISDRSFENLPAVFTLISPLLQTAPNPLLTDILVTLKAMVNRSPTETAYILRQALNLATGPNTARLIRRCLPIFEATQQDSLRKALQAANLDH